MSWWAVPALAAAAYYVLVIIAIFRFKTTSHPSPATNHLRCPAVSLLKPVRGRDPHFYEAIRSHALQDYPEYEILFGVADPRDPALEDIRRLMAEFPDRRIRIVAASTELPNHKVGVLAELAREARYPVLLINDSDIRVPPDYLRQVTAVFEQPGTGLVTCLYRAQAETWPGRWEALGVATEFVPSVLVARLIGSAEFALGSTMVLRAADLERIGGFPAIGDYLADDYQLGLHITRLGLRVAFAPVIVETYLDGSTWAAVWRHQFRWTRTIRVSRPGGYCGYLVTHATFWSLVAMLAGAWPVGVSTLTVRMLAGMAAGAGVLHDRAVLRYFYLMPFRDLWGFAIWICGFFGRTVEWRGQQLRLSPDGKIITDL